MKKDYTIWKMLGFYILIILLLILFSGCGPQRPDYVDDSGKEYSISERCVKSHTESDYSYHYGYNGFSGKFEWHWGWDTKTICDSSILDTTEINLDKKYYVKK